MRTPRHALWPGSKYRLIPHAIEAFSKSSPAPSHTCPDALFFRCYWSFHGHFRREAEQLFHGLESSYQKALQAHLRSGDSLMSLPASDRSSSSSQESLK